MDNIGATSSSQTSPNTGNPLNPQPIPPLASEPATISTIESIVSSPLEPVLTTVEPVGQTNIDGNVQAHFDINYQAHDVALASVPSPAKTNDHRSNTVFAATEHHKMDIDDSDEHPEKSKSCCSMLNKLFLALAIVCFALFLCSIAYIVANLEGLNGKYDGRVLSKINYPYPVGDDLSSSERLITEPYFNLTHPNNNGMIVIVSRRGASVHDILIPYKDKDGSKQYRSIVIKGGDENHFGAVRFGFNDPSNTMNMVNQLPTQYPFLNFYKEDWPMYADMDKPHRVRFVHGLIQIIYEFSLINFNEFIMTTMIATPSNQQIIVDPTNNIYFNLRSHGNLTTHYLNLSSSDPINIASGQKMEQDRLIQSQRVDNLVHVNDYFYKVDRAGIGKNYIATLSESETKTTMHVFSNHAGVIVDPFGVGFSNENIKHITTIPDMRGVRISPRQSPVYQPMSIYGPISVVFPSQAIHTTWWQFEYEH
ncbi:unnamed protein product [Adineta steineri]|uniref:Uncharacterized protein n=1 Tax=Adineta steineri TaxID=433720 RepID=A0A813SXA3_9BILA|nr:unnamed protein product [Adineta steineri]